MKKAYRIFRLKRRTAIMLFCCITMGLCCLGASVAGLVVAACDAIADTQKPVPYPLQENPPYTVAIDPGHGNFDTGAKGFVTELSVIDNTAKYLCDLLSADKNFVLVLTRLENQDPKISQRAEIANNAKASLLLSLHANSDKSAPKAQGFECYPKPPGRLYSEQSLKFAQIIVDKMKESGHKIRGENGIKFAYYNGKSKHMVDSTNTKIRTQKSFGIVEKPICPSVLAEQCFITNGTDVEKWGKDEGCRKAAEMYYTAICEYFNIVPTHKE